MGKSSLVKRIAELISFAERFYQFNLNAGKEKQWDLKSKIENISENVNGLPVILALDEFQHARSLDERGFEMDKAASSVIWDLLDNGQFQVSRGTYQLESICDLLQDLKYLHNRGVRVRNGLVISRQELFAKEMGMYEDYKRFFAV